MFPGTQSMLPCFVVFPSSQQLGVSKGSIANDRNRNPWMLCWGKAGSTLYRSPPVHTVVVMLKLAVVAVLAPHLTPALSPLTSACGPLPVTDHHPPHHHCPQSSLSWPTQLHQRAVSCLRLQTYREKSITIWPLARLVSLWRSQSHLPFP